MLVQRLLLTGLIALAVASPTLSHAQASGPVRQISRIDIAPHVREASLRFGLPEQWIYAVIRVESAGRTRAVSPAGAMGLMQLMPGTWARQRARFSLGSDPFDPRDNIMAGTSYLREMYDRYGAQGFLAAYNAGPGRYEDWLARRRSLPLETRRYVAKISPLLQRQRIFLAAALQPSKTVQPAVQQISEPSERTIESMEEEPPANPFARPAQPGHDLFVPVATGDQP